MRKRCTFNSDDKNECNCIFNSCSCSTSNFWLIQLHWSAKRWKKLIHQSIGPICLLYNRPLGGRHAGSQTTIYFYYKFSTSAYALQERADVEQTIAREIIEQSLLLPTSYSLLKFQIFVLLYWWISHVCSDHLVVSLALFLRQVKKQLNYILSSIQYDIVLAINAWLGWELHAHFESMHKPPMNIEQCLNTHKDREIHRERERDKGKERRDQDHRTFAVYNLGSIWVRDYIEWDYVSIRIHTASVAHSSKPHRQWEITKNQSNICSKGRMASYKMASPFGQRKEVRKKTTNILFHMGNFAGRCYCRAS